VKWRRWGDWYEASSAQIVEELRREKSEPKYARFRLEGGESVWEAFVRLWQGVNGENSPWLERYVYTCCLCRVMALTPFRLTELCGREGVLALLGGPTHAAMLKDVTERLYGAVYERAEREELPVDLFDYINWAGRSTGR
jgi:hypothetical protein